MKIMFILFSLSLANLGFCEGRIEKDLNYQLDLNWLRSGNFQYFYSLLKETEVDGTKIFLNLFEEQSNTPVETILETFLPLDTRKLWDSKEKHFLALAKISYLLPVSLKEIDEEKFTGKDYLQRTLPRYTVKKKGESFHVGGSLITPDFNVRLHFLKPTDPEVDSIPLLERSKLQSGVIKATLMHQDNFGRVFFFKTAKMASALIIYSGLGESETLVTQYILSNIINVPTKEMIRKGMVENIEDMVTGSRAAAKD